MSSSTVVGRWMTEVVKVDSNTLLKAGHSTATTYFICHITQGFRETHEEPDVNSPS